MRDFIPATDLRFLCSYYRDSQRFGSTWPHYLTATVYLGQKQPHPHIIDTLNYVQHGVHVYGSSRDRFSR